MTIATVIRDCYRWAERRQLHQALRDLFPSGDWHAAGVYAFWDPGTHDLLYLGIAERLATRFAQHNGLTGGGKGSKIGKIREWFVNHDRLGCSVYVQSALSEEGRDLAVLAEGQLLAAYLERQGKLPPWNVIGASILGRQYRTESSMGHVDALTGRSDGLIVARKTIRQRADDGWLGYLESTLHAARMSAVEANLDKPYGDKEILREINRWIYDPVIPGTNDGFLILNEERYWELPAPHPERDQPEATG